MTPESLRALADLLESDPTLEVRGLQLVSREGAERAPLSSTERARRHRRMQRETLQMQRNATLAVAPKEVPPQTPLPESTQLSVQKEAETEPNSGSGSAASHPESVRAGGAGDADATQRNALPLPLHTASRTPSRPAARDLTDWPDESAYPPGLVAA